MNRRDEPHEPRDWFDALADGRGGEHEGGEGLSDDRLRDEDGEPLADVDRAIDSLRAPMPDVPDLTASILDAVDERREFLCPKTRWWIKAVRVAACALVAGGALTAVLAWRYAPETTTLVDTPPDPAMLLLSAADAKACEGPSALRNGLTNVTGVEPAGLLRVVVGPMSPGGDGRSHTAQVRFMLAPAEPLPCACRPKMSLRVQQRSYFGSTWLQTVSVALPGEAETLDPAGGMSAVRPIEQGMGLRMPSAGGLVALARPTLSLNSAAGEPTGFVWAFPAQVSAQPASGVAIGEGSAARSRMAADRFGRAGRAVHGAEAKPLADGVGSLLGGSGGWIDAEGGESATETGVSR